LETATAMLNNVTPQIELYPNSFSNWLDLMLKISDSFYEIAIVGEDALIKSAGINKSFNPNKLIIGSLNESDFPLLENRYVDNDTYIYVCVKKACKLPVRTSKEALDLLN